MREDTAKALRAWITAKRASDEAEAAKRKAVCACETAGNELDRTTKALTGVAGVGANVREQFYEVDGATVHCQYVGLGENRSRVDVRLVEVVKHDGG